MKVNSTRIKFERKLRDGDCEVVYFDRMRDGLIKIEAFDSHLGLPRHISLDQEDALELAEFLMASQE